MCSYNRCIANASSRRAIGRAAKDQPSPPQRIAPRRAHKTMHQVHAAKQKATQDD
jgi:hypothetical protein